MHPASPNVPDDEIDALRVFSYFWDDVILSNICYATNQYARKFYDSPLPLDTDDTRPWLPPVVTELQECSQGPKGTTYVLDICQIVLLSLLAPERIF